VDADEVESMEEDKPASVSLSHDCLAGQPTLVLRFSRDGQWLYQGKFRSGQQ